MNARIKTSKTRLKEKFGPSFFCQFVKIPLFCSSAGQKMKNAQYSKVYSESIAKDKDMNQARLLKIHKRTYGIFLGITLFGLGSLVAIASKTTAERNMNLLFLGNSYTSFNDLPTRVAALAEAAGFPKPNVMAYAPGGYLLVDHAADTQATSKIQEGFYGADWDFVVLQEQSQLPATTQVEDFYAGALQLYDKVKIDNPLASVLLFETWARHAEWDFSQEPFIGSDPTDMQARLRTAYQTAANEWIPSHSTANRKTDVKVSFVGDAWERNYTENSPILLHQTDHSHPNPAGTYLAALVLFSSLYNRPSAGAPDLGMVSPEIAVRLQEIADQMRTSVQVDAFGSGSMLLASCLLLQYSVKKLFGRLGMNKAESNGVHRR